jgi:hypothetical protein
MKNITLYYQTAIDGLKSANRHNPFWSRSDALRLIHQIRVNAQKQPQG